MSTTIPAFHASGFSRAKGKGDVFIDSRKDAASSGIFHIEIDVHFDPAGADNYPAGSLLIKTDMNDGAKGVFIASSIELINSYGKLNPTIYLTGQCKSDAAAAAPLRGCRYWVMVANNSRENKGTPDIVGFCIHDRNGNRVAYGTGPLKGDIDVAPN
ncbi:hypothetical protein QWZ08_11280 [Ferruginibacter paludis]|uniref:hypothetical protein n=1 Tax=Ferruginibacter paludis TaxID=1310417 RepID=UPI0025B4119F|nr:hypothetical protein [Ferruginibacter paludis]MDN3656213.1 hypothetical protein [Ferruginibacter paludis]